MNKDEVKGKLEKVNAALAKIADNDDIVLYATKDKHLEGVGYIHEIDTILGLIEAQTEINNQSKSDFTEAVEMLGLEQNEIPETKVRILGFQPKHWNNDIKTRLGELRAETKLANLEDAKEKLTKWLSEDDVFDMDMEGVGELVESLEEAEAEA